jgi:hypothetical protein
MDSVLLTAGTNEADGAVEGLDWDGAFCECCGCEESDGEASSKNHRDENSTFHSSESVFKDLKQGKPFSNTYFGFQSLHIFRSLLVELKQIPEMPGKFTRQVHHQGTGNRLKLISRSSRILSCPLPILALQFLNFSASLFFLR